MSENMNFKNQVLSRQQLLLTDDEINILGPELELVDCSIISSCSNEALIFAGLKMKGGSFEQRGSLLNYHFERVHFDGTSFIGSFSGCDFGDWESESISSVKNSNFSGAKLDGVRFLRCKPESIIFPPWPCFTIINPSNAQKYVVSQSWPKKVGVTLSIYTDVDPECVAVTGDAERIAKKNELSLSEIKNLLQKIPGILITN